MVKAKQEPQPGLNFFFFSFPWLLFSLPAARAVMPRAAGESRGDVSCTAMNSLRAGQLTPFPHTAQSLCSEHPGQTQDAGGCEKGPGR